MVEFKVEKLDGWDWSVVECIDGKRGEIFACGNRADAQKVAREMRQNAKNLPAACEA